MHPIVWEFSRSSFHGQNFSLNPPFCLGIYLSVLTMLGVKRSNRERPLFEENKIDLSLPEEKVGKHFFKECSTKIKLLLWSCEIKKSFII